MKNKSKEICIGERIKEIYDKSGMGISQFTGLLHCDRANVYNIFRRKKIDIYLLLKISEILNHNFIDELCAQYGHSKEMPSSRISFTLEINSMDIKTLNKFFKTIKELEIKTIRES